MPGRQLLQQAISLAARDRLRGRPPLLRAAALKRPHLRQQQEVRPIPPAPPARSGPSPGRGWPALSLTELIWTTHTRMLVGPCLGGCRCYRGRWRRGKASGASPGLDSPAALTRTKHEHRPGWTTPWIGPGSTVCAPGCGRSRAAGSISAARWRGWGRRSMPAALGRPALPGAARGRRVRRHQRRGRFRPPLPGAWRGAGLVAPCQGRGPAGRALRPGLGPVRARARAADRGAMRRRGRGAVVVRGGAALPRRRLRRGRDRPARSPGSAGRLQLAVEAGGGAGLVLRPEPDPPPNAALTRWRAEPLVRIDGLFWRLILWRAKGGAPGVWTVRWDERALSFARPPPPGTRRAPPGRRPRERAS